MCPMNKVNDTASCGNDDLLMGLLKKELGFSCMVVPDGERSYLYLPLLESRVSFKVQLIQRRPQTRVTNVN